MKRKITLILSVAIVALISFSFREESTNAYSERYFSKLDHFKEQQATLIRCIEKSDLANEQDVEKIKQEIQRTRHEMKGLDFWFRYLEPISYRRINGPLPVEWETEVFEKFEKPYRREGAGLTLAALHLDEEKPEKDTLLSLMRASLQGTAIYLEDSITRDLKSYHHFYLCNRLFLLNLAAIYTTGFECPDPEQIIPELQSMLANVKEHYQAFNEGFPATPVLESYLSLYDSAIRFVQAQPAEYKGFDHFTFIKTYVNPLFIRNQEMIRQYKVVTRSLVDYSLNKNALSIFNKSLYNGQNAKGIFLRVRDTAVLAEIDRLGKLLYYDPILSGNNMRSCASCHKPEQFFTDTAVRTSLQFNRHDLLARNSPSLINADYNHLVMLDGMHFTLQHQTKAVVTNSIEMGAKEAEVLKKVMSCKEYKKGFTALLKYTPQEPEISFEHLAAALTYYYSKFSKGSSPFDDAMNEPLKELDPSARKGFNLFMGKAQCATCHFVPQFNGVKPPYIGSEFEVLGVPADTAFHKLSEDKGRYDVNPAKETLHAFRTGTIRNAAYTMPYMHNGVFRTLEEVIDFYDAGGGTGRGLDVGNQTLSADSLKLTRQDKADLISFIHALNENVPFDKAPQKLPSSKVKALNKRSIGGIY